MLTPETVLQDRYRIVRQLGQGGMGAVYEATDGRFGSTVALKQTLVEGEPLRRAFEREAKLLNTLQHAGLPHVIDYFSEGDNQFLVMQYIPGDDLGAMLRRRADAFPVADVVAWLDQLLDLLDYLHTHEPPIVHRDIKPENLKLTKRGSIILLDFGLAKGLAESATTMTGSLSVVGYTPNYAPLEQIRGTGTDARSDIYSVAATAYHLLTKRLPADAVMRAECFVNGQPDVLRPVNELNPAVAAPVAHLLHRALGLKRDDRPESAAAMRAMLKAAVDAGGAATTGAPAAESGATLAVPRSTQPQANQTAVATSAPQPPQTSWPPATPSGPQYSYPPQPPVATTPSYSGQQTIPPTMPPVYAAAAAAPPKQGSGLATKLVIAGAAVAVVVVLGIAAVLAFFYGSSGATRPSPAPIAQGQPSAPTPQPSAPQTTPSAPPQSGDAYPGTPVTLSASATSEREDKAGNSYGAENAVDGREETAWVEGADGEGIGESITVLLSRSAKISRLRIMPGYFKSAGAWSSNNRVESATITLSDGREFAANFTDDMVEQVVKIGGGPIDTVTITIDSVYHGGDEIDTAISEIAVDPQ